LKVGKRERFLSVQEGDDRTPSHRCAGLPDIRSHKKAIALPEETYRQMGVKGWELIKNIYSIEIVAQKMIRLYQWILGQESKSEFVYKNI
jgi:hypothetical protein